MRSDPTVLSRARELLASEPSGIEQLRILRTELGLSLDQAKEVLLSAGVGLQGHHAWIATALDAARSAGLFDAMAEAPWSPETLDTRLAADGARLLTGRGLPESVATLSFGERFARSTPDGFMIGEDTGHPISIELPSQRVVIHDGSLRPINVDVTALASCLEAYHGYREAVVGLEEDQASEHIEHFERAVERADPTALAPDGYWYVILEQMKHGQL